MLLFTHALTAAGVSYFFWKSFPSGSSFRSSVVFCYLLLSFRFYCFWCFSIIAAYLFLIFFSIHTSVCSALIQADYIVPCCFLIIPWWQQELPFFVFGYLLNKCIMSSAMGRRYSFITYLFLQMCTWHIFLFPASGIRPSYTRHLISGSRHRFFMIFIRSWCHMGLLLYSSNSSQHGHMRTLYNTKYFQSFLSLTVCYLSPASVCGIFLSCCQRQDIFSQKRPTSGSRRDLSLSFFYVYHSWLMFPHSLSFLRAFTCFLYISSAIDIFGYFPCLLRHTVFCYVLTAAGSRSSFGYYHLSRQQPLLRLSACTSLLSFFALISYRWYFLFITHKFFLFSCICIIYNWYLFFCFTAILHAFFFIYIIYDWHTFFSYLFCCTVFCYVLTAAGSWSSFEYYHLSRQQLLLCFICMHCFSITYVWCAYSFRTRYLITYIWCFFFAHVDFPTVLIIRSAIFITYSCLFISGMETIALFLLSLIYDAFSNLSIVFTSLISDDFSFKSGSRTRCIPYICGYFYLLYMMYIRFISSFISDNHLKIRWSTIPSLTTALHSPASIIAVGTAIDIWHGSRLGTLRHMWCIQSMWQQHGQ